MYQYTSDLLNKLNYSEDYIVEDHEKIQSTFIKDFNTENLKKSIELQ